MAADLSVGHGHGSASRHIHSGTVRNILRVFAAIVLDFRAGNLHCSGRCHIDRAIIYRGRAAATDNVSAYLTAGQRGCAFVHEDNAAGLFHRGGVAGNGAAGHIEVAGLHIHGRTAGASGCASGGVARDGAARHIDCTAADIYAAAVASCLVAGNGTTLHIERSVCVHRTRSLADHVTGNGAAVHIKDTASIHAHRAYVIPGSAMMVAHSDVIHVVFTTYSHHTLIVVGHGFAYFCRKTHDRTRRVGAVLYGQRLAAGHDKIGRSRALQGPTVQVDGQVARQGLCPLQDHIPVSSQLIAAASHGDLGALNWGGGDLVRHGRGGGQPQRCDDRAAQQGHQFVERSFHNETILSLVQSTGFGRRYASLSPARRRHSRVGPGASGFPGRAADRRGRAACGYRYIIYSIGTFS